MDEAVVMDAVVAVAADDAGCLVLAVKFFLLPLLPLLPLQLLHAAVTDVVDGGEGGGGGGGS